MKSKGPFQVSLVYINDSFIGSALCLDQQRWGQQSMGPILIERGNARIPTYFNNECKTSTPVFVSSLRHPLPNRFGVCLLKLWRRRTLPSIFPWKSSTKFDGTQGNKPRPTYASSRQKTFLIKFHRNVTFRC